MNLCLLSKTVKGNTNTMASVNPSRSMGNFKRYCTDRATSLNEFITTVKDLIPTPKEVSRLEELYSELKDQFR